MILSTSSDVLQVVTDAAVAVDVNVDYSDRSGVYANLGRLDTAISTATTTSVLTGPAAVNNGFVRQVDFLSARNKSTTTSVTVTVRHTDGTTAVEVFKAVLAAGDGLVFTPQSGWSVRNSSGVTKVASGVGQITVAGLTADVVNNNASANTIADVTGLSFPVVSGSTYWFKFRILYTADADTTGSRWSINGPATTYLAYTSEYTLTTTTSTRNAAVTAYDSPAAASATSVALGSWAVIEGMIRPSANGTVVARFASEVSSAAITAKIGSSVEYAQMS
jgi:hypothetical protein